MNTDDQIRAILHAEAETVDPSPAGWDAIQRGIAARQRRGWLFRGTALAGAALTVAGALFVLSRDGRPQGIEQPPAASATPTATASASASASPTVVAADPTPIGAIWPLTTRAEVAAWEADHATYPSLASPSGSALGFARGYLGASDATVASSDVRDGSLYFEVRRGDVLVTTLELRGFGAGGSAPYVVVAARSDAIEIANPESRAVLSSPLAARGTYHAADPGITVRVRADGGGSRPVELADARASTGPPNDWNATLSFTTTARTGSVLVTNASLRDSGIAAATAVPVTFGAANGGTAAPHVAIHDARIAYYGTALRYLSDQEPGGGPSHPDLSPDGKRVAWAQGGGTCASEVRVAPVAGGAATTIAYDAGTATFPVWLGADQVAYVATDCADASRRRVYVRDLGTGTSRALTAIGDASGLAADPRGRALAWWDARTITTYLVANGATRTVAAASGCRWMGVDVVDVTAANAPVLVTASACGNALRIERFAVGAPDRDRVADLAVDADAVRVEVADGAVLVSHWGGDPAPYVEAIGRDGAVTRFEDRWDASW